MASCTSTTSDPTLGLSAMPDQPLAQGSSLAGEQDAFINSSQAATPQASISDDSGDLPASVAFAPSDNPEDNQSGNPLAGMGSQTNGVPDLATATLTVPGVKSQPAQPPAQAAVADAQAASTPAAASETAPTTAQSATQTASASATLPGRTIENRIGSAHQSGDAVASATPAAQSNPQSSQQKRGFLSAFFAPSKANAAPNPIRETAHAPAVAQKTVTASASASAATPIQLASASAATEATSAVRNDGNSLPGVRSDTLFEITRKSGIDDDSDVDLHEGDESPVRVASAAGLARLAPNGLLKQTEAVDTACLKPALVRVLNSIEKHYGKKAVVTSGYRDPARNKRARGARNSLHMYCAAADIQVDGVSKLELAAYVRGMPGRGGVGTYCHTNSVHVDVGPERDWNWRCRRRK